MKINENNIGDYVGRTLYVCDFRYNDIFKKPIRHIKPTEVVVIRKEDTTKTIYYSSHCFAPVKRGNPDNNKAISVFDNTGFRSYPGEPVQIFDNYEECKQAYIQMCNYNRERLNQALVEFRDKVNGLIETIDNTIRDLN